MTKRILVLNGPNLNLLGQRQPEVYGSATLKDVANMCHKTALELEVTLEFSQSNHEGELVDALQAAQSDFDGVVLNAGALTHTSIAIMDTISAIDTPVLELHISNIHKREDFRHHSYVSAVAIGMICGLGINGYPLAVRAMVDHLNAKNPV